MDIKNSLIVSLVYKIEYDNAHIMINNLIRFMIYYNFKKRYSGIY